MSLIAKLLGAESPQRDYNRRQFLKDFLQDAVYIAGAGYLTGYATTSRPRMSELYSSDLDEILISGNERFTNQVGMALSLIREKDLDTYEQIRTYIKEIKQNGNSGMDVYTKTYLIGDRTAFHSVEWLAGTIAHDSTHSKLYGDYKENSGFVPSEIWTGQGAELKCNEVQAQTLKRIGAPQYMVDYARSSDGNHYDVNRDGKNDQKDLELRDW